MRPTESYPLQWPVGKPRTAYAARRRAQFGTRLRDRNGYAVKDRLTNFGAVNRLRDQLELLGARDVVISTNVPTRQDGLPLSKAREPDDPGVAVYFRLKGDDHCLACDRWDRMADNLAAIAAHVDAVRGQTRWGVGDLAQAFAGFRALPPVDARKPWWETLGFKEPPLFALAAEKRNELLLRHHPDRGGNGEQAAEINAAWREAERYYEGAGH